MEKGTDQLRTKPHSKRRLWIWIVVAVVVIVIILAIVLPLAIILPKRHHHHGSKAAILFPLYIYPINTSSWQPLYDALTAHPNLNFTVIVNPNSGPGSDPLPNDQYAAEVKKLNAFPNARTVGYVRTGYASRDINTVISEVNTYANWSTNSSELTMHGIFFDEAPSDYSIQNGTFMHNINLAVKNSTGLQGDKTVIHNPGAIPDARFNDSTTDITVVFEQSYQEYQTKEAALAALPKDRSAYSYMIHGVPYVDQKTTQTFVDQLSLLAEYLFVTTLNENFYESFDPRWANFTSAVPT